MNRSRTAIVIGSLVLSISATARLLLALDPQRNPNPVVTFATDPALRSRQGKAVRNTDIPIEAASWGGIRLDYTDEDVSREPSNRAVSLRRPPYHFAVGSRGQIRAGALWQSQRGLSDGDDVIHIGIDRRGGENLPTSEQVVSVASLVRQLSERCRIATDEIRLAATLADLRSEDRAPRLIGALQLVLR